MPNVTFLDWDSTFFGRKTGRIQMESSGQSALGAVLESARQDGYQLVYVFSDAALGDAYAEQLVDSKITYAQKLSQPVETTPEPAISVFTDKDSREELYELAYQSGEFSRFRVDAGIGEPDFKRFYRTWVDNSLSGHVARHVFIHKTNDVITGFITVQCHPAAASIGLLATDRESRGQGIGKALLNHVRASLETSRIDTLTVVTQRDNLPACRFYERNGFTVLEEKTVYHFWL